MNQPSQHRAAEPSWVHDGGDHDRTIEENWLFRLRRERFRSRRTDQTHDYYVMHLADAVNVVALTPGRHLILVEQFRAGSGLDSLETPGGLVDPGEDPLAAAARELREETGYAGDPPRLINVAWSNPSILSSRITTVLITNARLVAQPKPDDKEEVHVVKVPDREIPALIRDGRIGHALAVQGLLAWMISELPDNPLAPPTGRGRLQFRIATIMVAVVVSALGLWFVRSLRDVDFFTIVAASAFLASGLVVLLVLDPPRRGVLERGRRESVRRRVLRLLATVGLSVVWWLGLLLAYRTLFR